MVSGISYSNGNNIIGTKQPGYVGRKDVQQEIRRERERQQFYNALEKMHNNGEISDVNYYTQKVIFAAANSIFDINPESIK